MDKNEVLQVLNNLTGLVYELYPDPEFEDEYENLIGLKSKLEKAQAFINQLESEV